MTLTTTSGTDSNPTRNRSNSHAACRALAEILPQAFWPRREWIWEMMVHFRVAITCRHGRGYVPATTRVAAKGRAGKLGKAIAGSERRCRKPRGQQQRKNTLLSRSNTKGSNQARATTGGNGSFTRTVDRALLGSPQRCSLQGTSSPT